MALGSEMYDTVNLLVLHQLIERIEVADIHLHEPVIWLILDVLEVGEIASISKLIKVDDVVFRIFVYKQANNMRANEASTTSNDECSFILYHSCNIYQELVNL